jgi:hypothetical protein
VDHVVALADGGTDAVENLRALCAGCHASKTYAENLDRVIRRRATRSEFDTVFDRVPGGLLPCCVVEAELKQKLSKTFDPHAAGVSVVPATFAPLFWASKSEEYGIRFRNGRGVAGVALSTRSTLGAQ